jgi:signal transduction histidine kinase
MEQKEHLSDISKLREENKALQEQLLESMEHIQTIKTGNIDALISVQDNNFKIYTEHAADRTYRLLIENMHEGAVILNKEGVILYCNSHFAKMIKLPLQKVIGAKFKLYIEPSFKSHFEDLVQSGWKGGSQDEITLCSLNTVIVPVLISINPLTLEGAHVLSIILSDLSLQKNIQKELKERTIQLEKKNIELENANKDLTTFTYISSHDLQEPLRKIHNFVELINTEEASSLSEKGKVYFSRLDATAKRMQHLIEDLLAYSQMKAGERRFVMVEFSTIVNQVIQDYADVIQKKAATIEYVNSLKVRVILFQFNQLMHNLVWNSLKFVNPTTSPVIRIITNIVHGRDLNIKNLSREIDYCHISYSDNGIGFEPQYNERIFEVFQRLNSRESYAGTGMGLAICKRIVENHNGSITASGELGVGATFDIYIPA